MPIALLFLITAALPCAWFWAELRGSPPIRRALGITTLMWSFGVATLVGCLRDFSANYYFATATKDLLHASIDQLRLGRTDVVLREWIRADAEFHPTYENRAHYRQTVDHAITHMQPPPRPAPPRPSRSTSPPTAEKKSRRVRPAARTGSAGF